MLELRKLYTRHGRYDDIINMKFGFQSNKSMCYRVMTTGSLWDNHSHKVEPLVGDNWRLTLTRPISY